MFRPSGQRIRTIKDCAHEPSYAHSAGWQDYFLHQRISQQNHYSTTDANIGGTPIQVFFTSKPVRRGETLLSFVMPEEEPAERAREDEREGKSASTQAGEFVREEMEHIREGEHGARSPEQAIAIGLSKARRAGVELPPPKRGKARTKRQAKRDLSKGRTGSRKKPSRKRSRATKGALKRESRRSASKKALSRHAKRAAARRSARSRSAAAKKAARTRKRRH
jgi:hypothetical protein